MHPRFRQIHMAPDLAMLHHPGAYGAPANAAFSSKMGYTGDVRDPFSAHPRGALQDFIKTAVGLTRKRLVATVSRINEGQEGLKDERSMVTPMGTNGSHRVMDITWPPLEASVMGPTQNRAQPHELTNLSKRAVSWHRRHRLVKSFFGFSHKI